MAALYSDHYRQVAALYSDYYRQVAALYSDHYRQVTALYSDHYRQVAGYTLTPVHMCTHKLCSFTGVVSFAAHSPRENREHVQKSRFPTSEYQSSIHRICWRIPEKNRQKKNMSCIQMICGIQHNI